MTGTYRLDADLDMLSNELRNVRLEGANKPLPQGAEGQILICRDDNRIYVFSEGEWKQTGENNILDTISVNGSALPISGRSVDIAVPTKVSQLENDRKYVIETDLDDYYTKEQVDSKIEVIKQFNIVVVDKLPDVGESGVIYLVPSTNSKSKNVKDEYIWVDNAWEQIGSTSFKLDISQTAEDISINTTSLQTATKARIGLMTAGHVQALEGKQDLLTAGANITIENNIISAIGGGGGGAGHASACCTVSAGSKVVTVKHSLDSYELIFQLRTTVAPIRFVQADIVALDKNNVQVTFAEAPSDPLKLNIIACDQSVQPEPEFDVDVKLYDTASLVWTHENPTKMPLFVQLFDETGNNLKGDITQESSEEYTPVVVSLNDASIGSMLVASADTMLSFDSATDWSIDLSESGLDASAWYLVQIYLDGSGQAMGDISQLGDGIISIGFTTSQSGRVILRKATQVYHFTEKTMLEITHDLGRCVGAQVYLTNTGQAMIDIVCQGDNVVDLTFSNSIPVSGTALIL